MFRTRNLPSLQIFIAFNCHSILSFPPGRVPKIDFSTSGYTVKPRCIRKQDRWRSMMVLLESALPVLSALASGIGVFQFTTGFGNLFEVLSATTFMSGRDRSVKERYFNLSDYDAHALHPSLARDLHPKSTGNETYIGIETKWNKRFVVVIYKEGSNFRRKRILLTPETWDQWSYDLENDIFAFAEFTKLDSFDRPETCMFHLFDFKRKFCRSIKLAKDGDIQIFESTDVRHDELPRVNFEFHDRKLALPYVNSEKFRNRKNNLGEIYVDRQRAYLYQEENWYGSVVIELGKDLYVKRLDKSPSQDLERVLGYLPD